MSYRDNAAEFMADWWQLSGSIVTTLSALQRFKQTYPREYLLSFCHPREIATRAAALQKICGFLEDLAGADVSWDDKART